MKILIRNPQKIKIDKMFTCNDTPIIINPIEPDTGISSRVTFMQYSDNRARVIVTCIILIKKYCT